PDSIPYEGRSCALWGLAYDGDHFVDTVVGGLVAPDKVWPDASSQIELNLHATDADLSAQVAVFLWEPEWDDPDVGGTLTWHIDRRQTDGSHVGPFASVTVDYAPDAFPNPAEFRFEADTTGPVRVYLDGVLLGEGVDPAPTTGTKIGVYGEYFAGALSYGRTFQPGPPRFEQVAGGSNIPAPILLEPGVRVRIGVHHQTFGDRWFFHGYVDAIEPVYDPEARPVSRIECIDPLGEIGR